MCLLKNSISFFDLVFFHQPHVVSNYTHQQQHSFHDYACHFSCEWHLKCLFHSLSKQKGVRQLIMLDGNPLSDRRSPPASEADMENDVDAPELPFFFPDKDSICHEAICSLLAGISMISNNSTMQRSPWCHLYPRLNTDTTEPHHEGPAECPKNKQLPHRPPKIKK